MVKPTNVLCIVLLLIIPITQCYKTSDLIDISKNALNEATKSGFIKDLKSAYHHIQTLLHLGSKPDELKNTYKVCQELEKQEFDNIFESGLVWEYANLNKALTCNIKTPPRLEEWVKKNINNDRLVDFHTAASLGIQHNLVENDKIKTLCEKLFEFADKDGAAKIGRRKLETTHENSPLIFEIGHLCYGKDNSTATLDNLKTLASNVLTNSQSFTRDQSFLAEGDHFTTTVQNLYWILQIEALSKGPYSNAQKIYEFANYLRIQSQYSKLDSKEAYYFHLVSDLLESVPFPHHDEKVVISSGKKTITLQASNLKGENFAIEKHTKVKITADISQSGRLAVVDGLAFAPNKANTQYEAELDTNKLKNADFYQSKFSIATTANNKEFKFVHNGNLVGKSAISLTSVRYEVTRGKFSPDVYPHQLKQSEVSGETLSANQNSFIHVAIKPNKELPLLSQAAVRLIHPEYKYATGTVKAVWDKINYEYVAHIDVGDPDHILPYTATYDIEVVVAGPLLEENIKWKFAKFNIQFIKPAEKKPTTDADVNILPEIRHIFPGERKKPSPIVTVCFNALTILALGGFFIFLKQLNVNLNRFPTKFFAKIWNLLFLVVILCLLGILVAFWVKINLFETLLYLMIAMVPALIIGNWALSSLSNNGAQPSSIKEKSE
jgi:hypothetical protein